VSPMEKSAPGGIGERLKSLRGASGRSLEDLARELGVHFTTVSSWERGRSRPNYRTLSKLAAIFQVSPEYLLEEFAEPATPGRLVPGPTRDRFHRIPERDREELVGGLEEIRFLLMVLRIMEERSIRESQLQEVTGLPPSRLEALLEGNARPTVSEVLHLADALGIRIEERREERTGEAEEPSEDPADLLQLLRDVRSPVRARLVRLLQVAVRLAVGNGGDGRGGA